MTNPRDQWVSSVFVILSTFGIDCQKASLSGYLGYKLMSITKHFRRSLAIEVVNLSTSTGVDQSSTAGRYMIIVDGNLRYPPFPPSSYGAISTAPTNTMTPPIPISYQRHAELQGLRVEGCQVSGNDC